VRSVFLQGLFFLGQDEIAKKFPILVPHFERVQKVVQNYGMSMIEAALGFVLSQKEVDVALVGVTTIDELKTIVSTVESLENKDFSGSVASVVDTCFLQDETILNPSQWVSRG
jgi:aryl-alcohol dehydrogenase-like predicted oxidoreductase